MEEVAKELGYDSLAYFDRVFKKYTDMTPLQYRKMKKKIIGIHLLSHNFKS